MCIYVLLRGYRHMYVFHTHTFSFVYQDDRLRFRSLFLEENNNHFIVSVQEIILLDVMFLKNSFQVLSFHSEDRHKITSILFLKKQTNNNPASRT